MSSMFTKCTSFNQDISKWITTSVTNMSNMFNESSIFNQAIINWDTSSVTKMTSMFKNAYAFDQDLSKWDFSKVTSFISSGGDQQYIYIMATLNYDKLLISLSKQVLQRDITFKVGRAYYSAGEAAEARKLIIDTYGWKFPDNGVIAN